MKTCMLTWGLILGLPVLVGAQTANLRQEIYAAYLTGDGRAGKRASRT